MLRMSRHSDPRQDSHRVVIVSPALADANNGNWQTARRWQLMLSPHHDTRVVRQWPDPAASPADRVLLALHARRSADSIQAWAGQRGPTGLAVVLTGTDLYRDIHAHAQAARSLDLARVLVTLQDMAPRSLPPHLRPRARVVFQSTTQRSPLVKTRRHLRAVMVGHLREEKDPLTLMAAARLLAAHAATHPDDPPVLIDHIGGALDPALGRAARQTMRQCPGYRWLGNLPHPATRARIQRAHVLVHASRMEGGAHVIMEAVCSGTPVLASRIDGNLGMLGAGYRGCFEPGDAAGLAALLRRCAAGLAQHRPDPLLATLARQSTARAPLFEPAREQAALLRLVSELGA